MEKPLYALQRDGNRNVLAAGHFDYEFKLRDWLTSREFRDGDVIEFHALQTRRPAADEPEPAFIEPDSLPKPVLAAADDQPF
jgi:hypothetical protein